MKPMPKLLQLELIVFAIFGGCALAQQQVNLHAQSKAPLSPTVKPKPGVAPVKFPSISPKVPLKPMPGTAIATPPSDAMFVGAGDIADCTKPQDEQNRAAH